MYYIQINLRMVGKAHACSTDDSIKEELWLSTTPDYTISHAMRIFVVSII